MRAAITDGPYSTKGRRMVKALGREMRKHNLSFLDLGMTERIGNSLKHRHAALGRNAPKVKRPIKVFFNKGSARCTTR